METQNSISVQDVSKVYKMFNTPLDRLKEAFDLSRRSYHSDFFALSNISFSVKKGEIIGIMGRNGAGKSTLLKIISGILNPTYGTLAVNGRICSLLELGTGFNMEYTGIENIFFYGTLMGLSKQEIQEKCKDIIDFAEVGDYIYQPVKTYSSGMFARLAFSCAVNVDPEILIVDEILSVGDIRFQAKCFKKFKEFKSNGVTILYVGHDISTMRTFCDRCIWLNNGRIVAIGEPTYISAKYTEFMYLDDISEFTEYKAYGQDAAPVTIDKEIAVTAVSCESAQCETTVEVEKTKEKRAKMGLPLAHWGRKVGLLQNITMTVAEKELISCAPYDKVTVAFSLPNAVDIDYDNLSAAFSIKNREGVDLIVKTTFDEGIKFSASPYGHRFSFTFEPRLTNGEYYLVVALEDRKEKVITYYEYIEGAKYFKVFEEKGLFGTFLPDIIINIVEVK